MLNVQSPRIKTNTILHIGLRIGIATILEASIVETDLKFLAASHVGNARDTTDKIHNKLVGRRIKPDLFCDAGLEKATLAKTFSDTSTSSLRAVRSRLLADSFPQHVPCLLLRSRCQSSTRSVKRAKVLSGLDRQVDTRRGIRETNATASRIQSERETARLATSEARSLTVATREGNPSVIGRRSLLTRAAAAGASAIIAAVATGAAQASITEDADWPLWFALPLSPFSKRKTIRRDAGSRVWIFEQVGPGVGYIASPIRMTVVAMNAGGLFVYAPVAPTRECLSLLQPLIEQSGPIKYIVLPSVAIEHKVLAGPFAREFPFAEFYVTDKQYSLPIDLPLAYLGFPQWTKQLPQSSKGMGLWDGEFQHEVITSNLLPQAFFQDAAFFHEPTQTLLLCDTLISISSEPPPIFTSEPEYIRYLLFHARDDPFEVVIDTPEMRRKGWQRIAVVSNFFFPGSATFSFIFHPDTPMPEFGWGGVYPFTWRQSWKKSFETLSADGTPSQFPLVQIGLALAPEATRRWIDKVTQWSFVRVVPAHYDAPLAIGPIQFAAAFDFIRTGRNEVRFCDEDVRWIRETVGIFPPYLVDLTELGPIRGRSCGFV